MTDRVFQDERNFSISYRWAGLGFMRFMKTYPISPMVI